MAPQHRSAAASFMLDLTVAAPQDPTPIRVIYVGGGSEEGFMVEPEVFGKKWRMPKQSLWEIWRRLKEGDPVCEKCVVLRDEIAQISERVARLPALFSEAMEELTASETASQ
jgi:hypothetical protein